MVLQLRRWPPHRSLVMVGDSGYVVLDLLHLRQSLREPVTLISRLRLDAGLYAPAPPRQPGQMGRPRVKGPRLPTLKQLLDRPTLSWVPAPVAWYDGANSTLELASQTAVWYHCGKAPVPIRWVLVLDPKGELDTKLLLCTNLTVAPVQIVEWFVLRWQLEATFQEVRAHLGVETQRQGPGCPGTHPSDQPDEGPGRHCPVRTSRNTGRSDGHCLGGPVQKLPSRSSRGPHGSSQVHPC